MSKIIIAGLSILLISVVIAWIITLSVPYRTVYIMVTPTSLPTYELFDGECPSYCPTPLPWG